MDETEEQEKWNKHFKELDEKMAKDGSYYKCNAKGCNFKGNTAQTGAHHDEEAHTTMALSFM